MINSFLDVPEGPRHGVEIDEKCIAARDGECLSFERPNGRWADGSVGER